MAILTYDSYKENDMPIPPRPMADDEYAEGPQPSDEEMLETVHNAMGGGGPQGAAGPPPGSGMKWENLEEDQQALLQNPTPENVQAFVQYWGEDNLPPELQQMAQAGGGGAAPGGGGMY